MNRNLKSRMFGIVMSFMLMVTLFSVGTGNASAATVVRSFSFNLDVRPFGGLVTAPAWNQIEDVGYQADYIILEFTVSDGDTFDLRYVGNPSWLTEKTIIQKLTGLSAKKKNYIYYYIPRNMACPVSADKCVRVPIKDDLTDADHAALSTALVGFEFYSGSWLGGTLNVKGTITLMNN